MAKNTVTGQPGNAVPVFGPASTNSLALDYQVGLRRPHVSLSTATTYTVAASQTGTFFTYGGAGSGVTITLPTPQAGLWFEFGATGAMTSAATIFTCGTTDAFVHAGYAGTSGGVGTLQAAATGNEFTAAMGGLYVEIIGLSSARYLFKQWAGGSSVTSTASYKGASGGA